MNVAAVLSCGPTAKSYLVARVSTCDVPIAILPPTHAEPRNPLRFHGGAERCGVTYLAWLDMAYIIASRVKRLPFLSNAEQIPLFYPNCARPSQCFPNFVASTPKPNNALPSKPLAFADNQQQRKKQRVSNFISKFGRVADRKAVCTFVSQIRQGCVHGSFIDSNLFNKGAQ